MATDFHTHQPKSGARALVSCAPEQIADYPLASLQLHPWFLPEKLEPFSSGFLTAAGQAAALGEAGVDRLRGPSLEVQQSFLAQLLQLAQELEKPVVFHCVRALPELLQSVRHFPCNKLFHGFRGKPELLEQLRSHGFWVSLSSQAFSLLPYLRETGLEHIGFETDDGTETIESILEEAAGVLGISYRELEEATDRSFDGFLGRQNS